MLRQEQDWVDSTVGIVRDALVGFLQDAPEGDECVSFSDGEHQGRTDAYDEMIERLRGEAAHLERVGNFNASIYTEAADMLERDITREPQGD